MATKKQIDTDLSAKVVAALARLEQASNTISQDRETIDTWARDLVANSSAAVIAAEGRADQAERDLMHKTHSFERQITELSTKLSIAQDKLAKAAKELS